MASAAEITTEDWLEARRTAVPHQVPEMAAKIARARRQMEEITGMTTEEREADAEGARRFFDEILAR